MVTRFFEEFWALTLELAPYLLLGLFVAGLFRTFFSPDYIVKRVGRPGWRSSFWASLFGVPLPLCSCSVVPTGLSLRQQGASRGATVSFLTSTPQTGVDNITLNYSFFGLPMAIFLACVALVSGFTGGAITDFFSKKKEASRDIDHIPGLQKIKSLKQFFHFSFVEMVAALRKWLVIGLVLATLINMFLPTNLMEVFGGNRLYAYFTILAIAIPMYVCSSGSVPVAAALIAKGFPPGAAIVFLLAGPATNAATIALLWKTLGRRESLIYVLNIAICSIGFAYLFDWIYPMYQIPTLAGHHHMDHSNWWATALSVVFWGLMIYSVLEKYLTKNKSTEGAKKLDFAIEGVHCGNCVSKIVREVKSLTWVQAIELNEAGQCSIHVDPNQSQNRPQLVELINKLGYQTK